MESYVELGEAPADAFERAAARLRVEDEIEQLGLAPMQGTLCEDLLPDLRGVTKRRAIIYFVTEGTAARVIVLAVFFGGQDHQRRMLVRLLQG